MLFCSLFVAICFLATNLVGGAPPGQGQGTGRPERFTGILESVNISIRWRDGDNEASSRTFTVQAEQLELVLDLKRRIDELEGYPYSRQRLYLGWRQLEDNKSLADYGLLEPGRVVLLKIREWHATDLTDLVVHQVAIGRAPVTISTQLARTVASFKEELAKMVGAVAGGQPPLRLLLWGKELRDERRLIEYWLSNGTVLDLGRPLEACRGREVSISLRILSGAKLTITGINLAGTVAELKERIERETGVARQLQIIVFNATYMRDPDLLCDHGLEWDAPQAIYMMLYSSTVKTPAMVAQVETLVTPTTTTRDPHSGPVLHESVLESAPAAILSDERNWMFFRLRPTTFMVEFDPTARLVPCPGSRVALDRAGQVLRNMEQHSRGASVDFDAGVLAQRARLRMASSLQPLCPPWTSSRWEPSEDTGDCQLAGYGIELSGYGEWFARASAGRTTGSRLGSALTNYAPDTLEDSDVTFLFELAERVREQLARDQQPAANGAPQLRPQLGLARLRAINEVVMLAYVEAMAGFSLPQHGYQLEAGPDEECAMCRDELASEDALKLATCGHGFHEDCLLQWMARMYKQFKLSLCPYCRHPFRLRLEFLLGNVELR